MSIYLEPDDGRTYFQEMVKATVIPAVMGEVRGPRVLELGYGHGIWTGPLSEKVETLEVVDKDKELIEHGKKHHPSVGFWNKKFEMFAPDIRYDTVMACYVLEHVDQPLILLERIRGWLKPYGKLIVVVPNALSLHRRLGVAMGMLEHTTDIDENDRLIGHVNVFSPMFMDSLLKEAGYRILRSTGRNYKPLPQKEMYKRGRSFMYGCCALGEMLPIKYTSELIFFCEVDK